MRPDESFRIITRKAFCAGATSFGHLVTATELNGKMDDNPNPAITSTRKSFFPHSHGSFFLRSQSLAKLFPVLNSGSPISDLYASEYNVSLLEYTSPFSDPHVNAFLTPRNALPILETMTKRTMWAGNRETRAALEGSRKKTPPHHAPDAAPPARVP